MSSLRHQLRSLGFGGRSNVGILLGVGVRFFSEYDRLQTSHICLYSMVAFGLLVSFLLRHGVHDFLFSTTRTAGGGQGTTGSTSTILTVIETRLMGKWWWRWHQNPYILRKSSNFMTTFIELIQDRNWKLICQWLELDHSIHQMLLLDRSQQTILHHAILYRAPANVIEAILSKAPSLASVQNDLGEAPLHWAIRLETNREILNLLLKANPGAGVYCRDHNGITPLWLLWDRKTHTMSTDEIVKKFLTSPASWRRIEMLLDPPRGESFHRSNASSSLLHKVAGYPTPAGIFAVVYHMYRQFEKTQDVLGRTPLMIACSAPDANESYDDSVTKIQFLATSCTSETHSIANCEGRLPLHVALQSGITYGKGLEELIQFDCSDSLRKADPVTQLPLFTLPIIGACKGGGDDIQSVDTTYRLLRHDPSQIRNVIMVNRRRCYNN